MSRIDELIAEHCPNGVEFLPLKDIAVRITDGSHNPPKGTLGGEYPMISAKNISNGRIDFDDARMLSSDDYQAENRRTTIERGDVLLTIVGAIGRSAVVETDLPMVFQRSVCVIKLNREIALSRYIHHVLSGTRLQRLFEAQANGAAQKGIYLKQIEKLRIPLPPLEIQREIVRILDTFSKMEAELEAELEARKQQYDYFRSQLMVENNQADKVFLGEIASIGTGSHDTKDALSDGEFVFYARGREPLRLDTFDFDEDAIITAGDGVGVGKVFHFASGKYALHQRAYRIVPSANVVARYLYHYLRADFSRYLERTSVHASVTSLRRPMFLKYPVALPSMEEQQDIVDTLDKFDALVNDLSVGLPAELAARRRQYEYYRDRLLTFKELEPTS